MVERSLSMREVLGSIPGASTEPFVCLRHLATVPPKPSAGSETFGRFSRQCRTRLPARGARMATRPPLLPVGFSPPARINQPLVGRSRLGPTLTLHEDACDESVGNRQGSSLGNGHITLRVPVLVRSLKSSNVGSG